MQQATEELGLTPDSLLKDGIINQIILEYKPGDDLSDLRDFLDKQFTELENLPMSELIEQRQRRFRKY